MIAIRLWLDQNRIISTQRRTVKAVIEMTDALQQGTGPTSVGSVLADLLDRLTWHFEDVIANLEERVSELEDFSSAAVNSTGMANIADLRRQTMSLRRYLNPQREAMARLLRSEEHTSELQSRPHLVCRLLLEKKKARVTQRGCRTS